MSVTFANPAFAGHEAVIFAHDSVSGLKAIIAIHSTARGIALGGCRFLPYPDEAAALTDVLRLSEGMTYKAAAADLPFGGGKMVIIGEPQNRSPKLFEAVGKAIDRLGGSYVTGEDVGTTVQDMARIARETQHVLGLPKELGGSGDPSPSTALGCFAGIKAAVRHRLGRDDVAGLTVAVQGLGNVGGRLCRLLAEAGATLVVADVREDRVRTAVREYGASAAPASRIHAVPADILAPCALGNFVNHSTLPQIQAPIIAGGANNQLQSEDLAEELRQRSILYAPDFVINAGGMIQLGAEKTGWDEAEQQRRLLAIGDTLHEIFEDADAREVSTLEAARLLISRRIGESA